MKPRPWVLSPAYTEFVRSVRELHRFAVEGREESPEADAVREASDGPWYALTEIEKARAAGLSGDLDTLVDPPHELQPMNPQAQSKLNEFYEARERGDWDRALALLRRWAKYISPPLLAYLRGAVWQEAGDPESAALFFEHAHRLDPEDPRYFVVYLQTADPTKMRPEVDAILEQPETRPLSLLTYAVGAASQSVPRPSRADFLRFAAILHKALDRPADSDSSLDSSLRPSCHMILGLCLEAAGESRAAMDSYTRGLAIDPDKASLLAARGLLGYGSNPNAIEDLERAVRNRVDMIWPYFTLAHHHIRQRRFRECLQLCQDALRFDGPETARSELAEWTAIARAELGFPPAMVREAFEEAVRLDPSNERARHNRGLYEERLASPQEEPRPYEARSPQEIRASVPSRDWFQFAA